MNRWRENAILKYSSPTPKIILLGVGTLLIAVGIKMLELIINKLVVTFGIRQSVDLMPYFHIALFIFVLIIAIAIMEKVTRKDKRNIKYLVKHRLCAYTMGNPLHLRYVEIEPTVSVYDAERGFKIRIGCASAKYEDVAKLESVISDCLRKKYGDYAVVNKEEDIAGRYVDYLIEDVVSEYQKQSVYLSLDDVPTDGITKLYIRDGVHIDYSKVLNSSALVVGKTRSGKSTGIISVFLLPVLKRGADAFGSKVISIDPKNAELSQCAHVISPDINNNVEKILEAVKGFNLTRIERQQIINEEGKKRGKAAKWFEIGMKPSLLFVDEWVALQGLFPKKASKENPDYCLAEFQSLIQQIATQGASAGCFLIISIAQASVGVGGLDTVVKNACGIRIMFKPEKEDASFIWDSKQLEVLREWSFSPGDAWFSVDDGVHNRVSFVKFPRLDERFDEYRALSELLEEYYKD